MNFRFRYGRLSRSYSFSLRPVFRRFFTTCNKHAELKTAVKEPRTKLLPELERAIRLQGSLPTSHFMAMALSYPKGGYYTQRDVFGQGGDFITSPEISPLFGEMLAVWTMTQIPKLAGESHFQLIELGPGRGTLLADLLHTWKKSPNIWSTLKTIHLVESSPVLRKMQLAAVEKALAVQATHVQEDELLGPTRAQFDSSLTLQWHESALLADIPSEPFLLLAHEFFDALPVDQYQLTENGWREVKVDLTEESDDGPHHLRFVLSEKDSLKTAHALDPKRFPAEQYKTGDTVEYSRATEQILKDVLKRMSSCERSLALVMDYGHERPGRHSLRGIRNHQFVHPLSMPGDTDLSADVDFDFLKSMASEGSDVSTYDLLTQADFLKAMGIEARMLALLRQNKLPPKEMQSLVDGFRRLVDTGEEGMGRIYKFFAVSRGMTSHSTPDAMYPFRSPSKK